jgi:hypothetical protein
MSAVDGARNCATSRCISFGAWCKAHSSIKTWKSMLREGRPIWHAERTPCTEWAGHGLSRERHPVVIDERRGDWVSITPQAKRSETSVWVRYSDLDCDFVDDVCRKAEREGKTPKQFAEEMLRGTKPVRRTDQQLRNAAFTAATMIVLNEWCRVPLTYCEQVEIIVIGTQVGSDRLNGALNELEEGKKNWAHPNFAYAWRRAYAAKWSGDP